MTNLEDLTRMLAKKGYHVLLHWQGADWHCTLPNSVIKAIPSGRGESALEAVCEANSHRVKFEADPRYKAAKPA